MSVAGSAPKFASRMNKAGVPWGGIAMTGVVTLIGVGLNAVVPSEVFEITLNVNCLGLLSCWAVIIVCQLRLFKWSKKGLLKRPSFRMLGAPYTSYLVLAFLFGVLVLIAFDYPVGTFTIASIPVIAILLVIGWLVWRDRIADIAEARTGHTGTFPVIANVPQSGSLTPASEIDKA
jgi:L-asparagine permease